MARNFYGSLIEHLKDKEYAHEYLTVALETYDEDANIEAFLTAIRDIAKAQGGFSKLAKKTSLNRSNLYTQLSRTGNPSFQTIDTVLHGLGFGLTIRSLNNEYNSSLQKC
jgi:probable addiction module antidote protein